MADLYANSSLWAVQCTPTRDGVSVSSFILVITPVLVPCITDAPSAVYPTILVFQSGHTSFTNCVTAWVMPSASAFSTFFTPVKNVEIAPAEAHLTYTISASWLEVSVAPSEIMEINLASTHTFWTFFFSWEAMCFTNIAADLSFLYVLPISIPFASSSSHNLTKSTYGHPFLAQECAFLNSSRSRVFWDLFRSLSALSTGEEPGGACLA